MVSTVNENVANSGVALHRTALEPGGETCSIFGITLACDLPLSPWLPLHTGAPELSIAQLSDPALLPPFDPAGPLYTNPYRDAHGDSLLELYRAAPGYYFQFPQAAFYLSRQQIVYHSQQPLSSAHLLNYLHNPLLPFWLEQQGIPVLHATGVSIGGRAVAFLAHSGGGKTTIAAAFVQAGYALLTDDGLPVAAQNGAFVARPGYPVLRMWPEAATTFAGGYERFEPVQPGASKRNVPVGPREMGQFLNLPQPLAHIYILDRYESSQPNPPISIQPLSPRDAALKLIEHSALPRIVSSVGLSPQRFIKLTQIAHSIPVSRLTYPAGYAHLPRLRQAILERLDLP